MTSTAAMSMTHPRTAPGLERVTVVLLLCFVAALQISIAAADILLSLMMVCWVAQMVQEKMLPGVPRVFWPLAAYAAVTVIVMTSWGLTQRPPDGWVVIPSGLPFVTSRLIIGGPTCQMLQVRG